MLSPQITGETALLLNLSAMKLPTVETTVLARPSTLESAGTEQVNKERDSGRKQL